MSTVVMERTQEQAVTDEQLEGMKEAAEACFEINNVKRLQTLLSADRKRFVCILDAPDVQAVTRSLDSAGISYDHVWSAESF